MNCPVCGTALSDGAVFCHSCGSPVSVDQYVAPEPQPNQESFQQPYQQPAYPQQNYQQPVYQQPNQDAYQQAYRAQPQPTYSQQPYQQPYQQPMYAQPVVTTPGQKSKVAAGILAILLGALGIHKFYLGYTKAGVIMLLVTLLTFGIGAMVFGIIGVVEGIIYLTKSDQEFYQIYEVGEKQWF